MQRVVRPHTAQMDVETSVDLTGNFAGDLHGVLSEAAQRGPLAVDVATGATVVLRQRDLEALAHDQRLEGIGLALFDMMGITDGPLRDWYSRLMFTTEGDYHRRTRSLVSRAFTPRSVQALRARAADMAADAVASVSQGGDLVAAFSTVATRLMCRLLGVPDSDIPVFVAWLDALSPVFAVMTPEQIAAATTAITELQRYVDELATRHSKDPGNDLITALLASEADGERLTRGEAVTMIANLLVAGHDTAGPRYPAVFWSPCNTATNSSAYMTRRGWRMQSQKPCAWSPVFRLSPAWPWRRLSCTTPRLRLARWSFSALPPLAATRRPRGNLIISTPTAFRGPTHPNCSTSAPARTTAWATPWRRSPWRSACARYWQRIPHYA